MQLSKIIYKNITVLLGRCITRNAENFFICILFYGFFKNKNIVQTNFKCFIETVIHYEYN